MSQTPEDPREPGQPSSEPDYGTPTGGGAPDYGTSTGGGPDYTSPTPPPAPAPPGRPAYGAPTPPPHTPDPQNPYAPPPPAGYAQQPYGAPMPPATPYGPAYGGPTELPPSKGMAITAMVFSFLVCIPILPIVAIVLAIIVLRRGKDGRNHGKGLAIGALIVAPIMLVATTLVIVGIAVVASSYKNVNDLETRQCFDGLDADRSFRNLTIVDCSDPHDGQVLATVTLSASEASAYADSEDAGGALCAREIGQDEAIVSYLSRPGLEPLLLTDRKSPDAGDTLACVVHRSDGKKITDSVDSPAGGSSSDGSGTGT